MPLQVHDILVNDRPGALRELRRSLAALVGDRVGVAALDDALVVASELVANAQEYGGEARCRLRVTVLDRAVLRLEVIDASPLRPPDGAGAVPDDAESGRGLLLVAGLARRWGSGPHRLGKCVWAELELTGGPAEDDRSARRRAEGE